MGGFDVFLISQCFIYLQALAEAIGKVERLEQDLQMTCVERAKYKRFEDEVTHVQCLVDSSVA